MLGGHGGLSGPRPPLRASNTRSPTAAVPPAPSPRIERAISTAENAQFSRQQNPQKRPRRCTCHVVPPLPGPNALGVIALISGVADEHYRSRPFMKTGQARLRRAFSHLARGGSLAAPRRLAKPVNLLNPSLAVRQVVSSRNG